MTNGAKLSQLKPCRHCGALKDAAALSKVVGYGEVCEDCLSNSGDFDTCCGCDRIYLNTVDAVLFDFGSSTGSVTVSKNTEVAMVWSADGTTWSSVTAGTAVSGSKVYIRAADGVSATSLFAADASANAWKISSGCAVSGNIMSLLGGDTLGPYAFDCLFYNQSSITDASGLKLPAAELASYCYFCMFYGCTSLTQAPELPATTLATRCYCGMFFKCTSLTQAPELPAATLAYRCYDSMFYGCTKLSYVKSCATSIGAIGCLTNWLNGVASSGDFYRPSSMNGKYSTGASGIPSGWTQHDNRCESAAELIKPKGGVR